MTIYLNDKAITINAGTTLARLLLDQKIPQNGIATAINGNVVPATQRDSTILSDGDKIIIISAFYGG